MAAIGGIQLAGNGNAGPVEVETNMLAARFVLRPQDFAFVGAYGVSCINAGGTGPTIGNAGQVPYVGFCWGNPNSIAVFKKVHPIAMLASGANAATFQATLVRFTFQRPYDLFAPSNGTQVASIIRPSKLRSTFPESGFWMPYSNSFNTDVTNGTTGSAGGAIMMPSTNGVGLQGGDITRETQPIAALSGSVDSTFSARLSLGERQVPMYEARLSDYPLILTQNTGFEVQFGYINNTNTTAWIVNALWEEYILTKGEP